MKRGRLTSGKARQTRMDGEQEEDSPFGGTHCLVRWRGAHPAPIPPVGRKLCPVDSWSGWELDQGPLGLFYLESENGP